MQRGNTKKPTRKKTKAVEARKAPRLLSVVLEFYENCNLSDTELLILYNLWSLFHKNWKHSKCDC